MLVTVTLITFFGLLTNGAPIRERRWITSHEHASKIQTEPTNPYQTNSWYQYAQFLANATNNNNCYVCSLMPLSSTTPRIIPEPYTNVTALFPHVLISASTRKILQHTVKQRTGQNVKGHKDSTDFSGMLKGDWSVGIPLLTHLHLPHDEKYDCFSNQHPFMRTNVSMGEVPLASCRTILSPCTRHSNGTFNTSQAARGSNCTDFFQVPDEVGTFAWSNVYWLCGHSAYVALPHGWIGRCAPILATHHSYVVSAHVTHTRKRRGAEDPHDPIMGTNVPDDQKVWSVGQKVLFSAIPNIGVGKVMLRVETLEYRFGLFINSTLQAMEGIKEELTALRLMVLQNRMVLDQMAAAAGGVCAIIGDSCCTYIPENDKDYGTIGLAIANLTKIRDTMARDKTTDTSLWPWLTSGGISAVLQKVGIFVVCFLLLLCVSTTCILPCIRHMMGKMITQTVVAYARVHNLDPLKDYEEDIPRPDDIYENLDEQV